MFGEGIQMSTKPEKNNLQALLDRVFLKSVNALSDFFKLALSRKTNFDGIHISYLHPDIKCVETLQDIHSIMSSSFKRILRNEEDKSIIDMIILGFVKKTEDSFIFRILGGRDALSIFTPDIQKKVFGPEITNRGVPIRNFINRVCGSLKSFMFLYPAIQLLVTGFYAYESKVVPVRSIPLSRKEIDVGFKLIEKALKRGRKSIAKKHDGIQIYDILMQHIIRDLEGLLERKIRPVIKSGIVYLDFTGNFASANDGYISIIDNFLSPETYYIITAIPLFGTPFLISSLILTLWLQDGALFSSIPIFSYVSHEKLRELYRWNARYVSRFIYEAHTIKETCNHLFPDINDEITTSDFIQKISECAPGYRIHLGGRLGFLKDLAKKLGLSGDEK